MHTLITPAEAEKLIFENLPDVPSIRCPLKKCAGRILREVVLADRPLPPFNRSMMDGYAIRFEALRGNDVLTVTAQAPAGSPQKALGGALTDCAEIMTGAMLPTDADTVVPYELTEPVGSERIRIVDTHAIHMGDCIHAKGSDHNSGTPLLPIGDRIGSREIAIAATAGYSELNVSKIPSIAIISTGDELVPITEIPLAHQIRRSNDICIETALAAVQLHAQSQIHLPDDPIESQSQLAGLIETNTFVVISGGISKGKKDFIPDALSSLGLKCHFHGVAQKPGKPLGYWSNERCAVFALPGNPISTLTCLHRYVIPAIFKASKLKQDRTIKSVPLLQDCRVRDDITTFLPVALDANNQALPCPINNSGDLVSILASDGFVELAPRQTRLYPAETRVDFRPWY